MTRVGPLGGSLMRGNLLPGSMLPGSLLALGSGLACAAFSLWVLGGEWYISVLLPLVMMLYVLSAWLIHMREDSLMRPSGENGEAVTKKVSAVHKEAAFVRWDDPPLPRSQAGDDAGRRRADGKRNMLILLVAAVELGVAAALLYAVWGVGSRLR